MYEIEKGVPVPPNKHLSIEKRYPLATMDVGDSFFVEFDKTDEHIFRSRLSNAVAVSQRRHNRKFCTRKVEGGIRVWRIE